MAIKFKANKYKEITVTKSRIGFVVITEFLKTGDISIFNIIGDEKKLLNFLGKRSSKKYLDEKKKGVRKSK